MENDDQITENHESGDQIIENHEIRDQITENHESGDQIIENHESDDHSISQYWLSLRPPFQSPPPSPQTLLSLRPPFQSPPPSPQTLLSLRLPTQSLTPPLSLHLSLQPPPHPRPPQHPLLESSPPLPSAAEPPPSLLLPVQSPLLPLSTQQTQNEADEEIPSTQQTQNKADEEIPSTQQTQDKADEEIPRPKRQRTHANTSRVEPPYPWSTEQGGIIHKLEYLQANNILTIKGEVICKKCGRKDKMEYDLMSKFEETIKFIEREKSNMHDRAPDCWINPTLLNCKFCNREECVVPIILQGNENNIKINWLFLLLGNFLGCLKLGQLKYFCTQTNIHRTGAKDRLVYLTYFGLCKQLQPSFDL